MVMTMMMTMACDGIKIALLCSFEGTHDIQTHSPRKIRDEPRRFAGGNGTGREDLLVTTSTTTIQSFMF